MNKDEIDETIESLYRYIHEKIGFILGSDLSGNAEKQFTVEICLLLKLLGDVINFAYPVFPEITTNILIIDGQACLNQVIEMLEEARADWYKRIGKHNGET